MTSEPETQPTWHRLLSQTLRRIRLARRLRVGDAAAAMGLNKRTYELFEAGGGSNLSLERIHQFAGALGADPHSILASVMIGSPAFALRTADNKLMGAFLIALQEFDAAAGDDIKRVDTATLLTVFTAA